jgi:hypothetical protein
MKYLIILISVICSLQASAQVPAFVTIKCELKHPLAKKQALYIRGNHTLIGNWNFGKVHLAKRSDTLWAGIFLLQKGSDIEFVLDGGSETKYFNGMDTVRFKVISDTTITVSLDSPLIQAEIEKPTGQMHFLPSTATDDIRDRLVTVRTPIGYESDTLKRYPVVYLQDGQSMFTTDKSPDGFEWRMDETLDSLEFHGLIDPFILVAIDHVFDARSLEFSDNELGASYRSYLQYELPRSIDRQFRTIKRADARYLGGAVAGGFVSCLTAWEAPDIYGNVIALSPALEIYENNYFSLVESYKGAPKPIKYYVDIGEFGMDELIEPGYQKFVSYLDEFNYTYKKHFEPNSIPDGENMARRIIPALMYFFQRKTE